MYFRVRVHIHMSTHPLVCIDRRKENDHVIRRLWRSNVDSRFSTKNIPSVTELSKAVGAIRSAEPPFSHCRCSPAYDEAEKRPNLRREQFWYENDLCQKIFFSFKTSFSFFIVHYYLFFSFPLFLNSILSFFSSIFCSSAFHLFFRFSFSLSNLPFTFFSFFFSSFLSFHYHFLSLSRFIQLFTLWLRFSLFIFFFYRLLSFSNYFLVLFTLKLSFFLLSFSFYLVLDLSDYFLILFAFLSFVFLSFYLSCFL